MKILMPVDSMERSTQSVVKGLFDTKCGCVYDSEEGTFEWIMMSSISKKDGNLSVELKRREIKTVICSNIPTLALDLFSVSGFTLYKSNRGSIGESVNALKLGMLDTFGEKSGQEACAPSACSSCSSSCG